MSKQRQIATMLYKGEWKVIREEGKQFPYKVVYKWCEIGENGYPKIRQRIVNRFSNLENAIYTMYYAVSHNGEVTV